VPAYFFDTSALVKRYAVEQGSDWVQSVAVDRGSDIYIASVTTVEVTSAVARKLRGGHLSQVDADRILQ
jgi:predicted nucleic acid-binding protein